jgi:N utilization substance protein B
MALPMTEKTSERPYRNLGPARRKARHFGMQALYGWDMSGDSATDIIANFRADNDMSGADMDYFAEAVRGVIVGRDDIDAAYAPYLDNRRVDQLDKVELALLRLATWELLRRPDVPFRVAIDEAVALARKFGAAESHRYVNGVLDKVARKLRATEVAAGRGG